MKIGIIGNMNNMYFSLARYLIDEGYNCELLIFDFEPEHFHPGCDTFDTAYQSYTKQLTWGDPAGFLKGKSTVKADLENYDFLIGNGSAPAFVKRIGRKLDIFIPYGDDLYSLPFLKLVHPVRMLPYAVHAWYQRKGIREAAYIMMDKTNPPFEKILESLDVKGKRITCPPPLLYHKEYTSDLQVKEKENPYLAQLKKIREENDLVIVQHIRQFWVSAREPWHLKGNNWLIEGYADFLQAHPGIKSKLLLFDYGLHAPDTRKLIEARGISSHVVWFPKMQRKHLMSFVQYSDLVVGELYHSWLTYCVVLETLSMGTPLMQKRNDADFSDAYTELYPMLHASSPETVRAGLEKVLSQKEETEAIGKGGREWFLKYCVERPISEISRIIADKELQPHA